MLDSHTKKNDILIQLVYKKQCDEIDADSDGDDADHHHHHIVLCVEPLESDMRFSR